ncbi:hypothetical protein CROQUDRAFT_254594 [Cronartium quercuum f. sp. fusiforme G11]|uniref:Uncharacterized protein n=1 Tax=Cronartium quercuum f. sp. fusiforme G11 TaxID=708437 RepID=A0A9P6N8S3_9BASI|nr:hypothetical protein CROQUDRAFT_254594 [Cronartium quercuum f. sp. fusiforme G11]
MSSLHLLYLSLLCCLLTIYLLCCLLTLLFSQPSLFELLSKLLGFLSIQCLPECSLIFFLLWADWVTVLSVHTIMFRPL